MRGLFGWRLCADYGIYVNDIIFNNEVCIVSYVLWNIKLKA